MLSENKIACFFLQLSIREDLRYERYDPLAQCAVNSFKKFHSDIEVFHVTNDNIEYYFDIIAEEVQLYDQIGLVRYIIAEKLMRKLGIQKMIVLGIDTITCARLDEFLNDDTDVLATLNYPGPESTAYWSTPIEEFTDASGNKHTDVKNLNADVVCFNNVDAFARVNELAINHFSGFGEQGGLNELALVDKSFTVKVIDYPYFSSPFVYNARSKGVFGTAMCTPQTPQMLYYVKDGKLFTHDHKQIKVWHLIEGLSDQNAYEFKAILDNWKFNLLNADTKKFFKEQCDCGDYFETPYNIEKDWFGRT